MRFYLHMESLLHFMVKYYGIDWLGVALMFLSTWFLAKKRRTGFLFGFGNNLCWMAFGILTGSVADFVANMIVSAMNLYAYTAWKPSAANNIPAWLTPRSYFPFPSLT